MNENCVLIGYRIYRRGTTPAIAIFSQGSDRKVIIDKAVEATKDDGTAEVCFIYEDKIGRWKGKG